MNKFMAGDTAVAIMNGIYVCVGDVYRVTDTKSHGGTSYIRIYLTCMASYIWANEAYFELTHRDPVKVILKGLELS